MIALLSVACVPSPGDGPGPTTSTTAPPALDGKVVGYFIEWGVYARNFQPKNLVTSGAVSKLTHVNIAFGNVTNGQCTPGDTFAETGKSYDAASSVDGVADSPAPGTLRGIFGQFLKLKAMYPDLKVLWSFGGATWSGGFSQAAQDPAAFADSCFSLVNDPRWAGLFDGIDIDWEYPNACGQTCDASGPAAFGQLMAALNTKFDNQLVTAAVPASPAKIAAGNYGAAANHVDWFNVMAYDYFGAWAPNGPTAAHSPLTNYPAIPTPGLNAQATITAYRSQGIPASKLALGVGSYGRGWTGVTQTAPGGAATGPAPGTWTAGVEDYKVLATTCPPTGIIGGTAYAHCGSNWWSYDTPETLITKATWAKSQGLAGMVMWELSGDTPSATLITTLWNNR